MRADRLTYARIMLTKWAAQNISALPVLAQPGDYRSPGRGTRQSAPDIWVDPDLEKVEHAVCTAEPQDRTILQYHYLRSGPVTYKYRRLGICKQTYYNWLERAQWYIKQALD